MGFSLGLAWLVWLGRQYTRRMETEGLEEKSEIERLAREVNRLKKQVAALQIVAE